MKVSAKGATHRLRRGRSFSSVCLLLRASIVPSVFLCVHYPLRTVPGLHWQCVNYSHRSVAFFSLSRPFAIPLTDPTAFPADSAHSPAYACTPDTIAGETIYRFSVFHWFAFGWRLVSTDCCFWNTQTERTRAQWSKESRQQRVSTQWASEWIAG